MRIVFSSAPELFEAGQPESRARLDVIGERLVDDRQPSAAQSDSTRGYQKSPAVQPPLP